MFFSIYSLTGPTVLCCAGFAKGIDHGQPSRPGSSQDQRHAHHKGGLHQWVYQGFDGEGEQHRFWGEWRWSSKNADRRRKIQKGGWGMDAFYHPCYALQWQGYSFFGHPLLHDFGLECPFDDFWLLELLGEVASIMICLKLWQQQSIWQQDAQICEVSSRCCVGWDSSNHKSLASHPFKFPHYLIPITHPSGSPLHRRWLPLYSRRVQWWRQGW